MGRGRAPSQALGLQGCALSGRVRARPDPCVPHSHHSGTAPDMEDSGRLLYAWAGSLGHPVLSEGRGVLEVSSVSGDREPLVCSQCRRPWREGSLPRPIRTFSSSDTCRLRPPTRPGAQACRSQKTPQAGHEEGGLSRGGDAPGPTGRPVGLKSWVPTSPGPRSAPVQVSRAWSRRAWSLGASLGRGFLPPSTRGPGGRGAASRHLAS